jgi:hypothetical protein
MPNFHTHWLVALQGIDGLPEAFRYLSRGRTRYVDSSQALARSVRDEVRNILGYSNVAAAGALQDSIAAKVKTWEDKLRGDDDAICFSAFMLGACGPDFWTLPSEPDSGIKPDFASQHFDLGHYNRTHLQFEVSLRKLREERPDPFQARVEQSYFLGMATHLGGDLVLHQLVNVSAGAYDLLKFGRAPFKGTWSNEQGYEILTSGPSAAHGAGDVGWIWTTHNKVEHYWDTWVRYRWLGDFGAEVWKGEKDAWSIPGVEPLGLPLCDTLRWKLLARDETVAGMDTSIAHAAGRVGRWAWNANPWADTGANDKIRVQERVNHVLGSVETRWLLEKPLAFPWLFCDAVLAGRCQPFIYRRVVDKDSGAYPKELLYDVAREEAESPQMLDPAPRKSASKKAQPAGQSGGGGRSEKRKLQFFSTERNLGVPIASWNYLNYLTCPNLERLRMFGRDRFFDRSAFPPFVSSAIGAASTFAHELGTAYTSQAPLQKLGRFWNLDTGLGIDVQSVESPDRHQAITRIDWVHVLGPSAVAPQVAYTRPAVPGYTPEAMPEAAQPYPALSSWTEVERAFTTYQPEQPFPSLSKIVEEADVIPGRKYLDRIRVKNAVKAPAIAPIHRRLRENAADDAKFEAALFVADGPASGAGAHQVPTGQEAVAKVTTLEHRLDLIVRARIARLGAAGGAGPDGKPQLAMLLLGDDGAEVQPAATMRTKDDEVSTDWLREKSKILDRVTVPDRNEASEKAGLATFSARIIVNASKDTAAARLVTPAGSWNNVVPYERHKRHYGRNFAVATARTHVLRGETPFRVHNFDANAHFKVLRGLGLTEHCFFTLVPLVRIGGKWIDAFSKGEVTSRDQLAVLKKVDAINFVKIVLLYVLDHGVLQLDWCYIDGVRRKVTPAPASP